MGRNIVTIFVFRYIVSKIDRKNLVNLSILKIFFICFSLTCVMDFARQKKIQRTIHEAVGSGKLTEYSKLSQAERRKQDEEWAKSLQPTRPKDVRDD